MPSEFAAILDANGNTVVSYGYDAWGAPLWCTGELAETLGKVQAFRYRGYVFDEETGLYYLRSRYYNPRWGRFANADATELIAVNGGLLEANVFAYCSNNPIARLDPNGQLWLEIGLGLVAGIVGKYISDVVENIQDGKTGIDIFTPTSNVMDYVAAGVGGAIAAFLD